MENYRKEKTERCDESMKRRNMIVAFLAGALLITGCGKNQTDQASGIGTETTKTAQEDVNSFLEQLDTSSMFTERDMEQGYEAEGSVTVHLEDGKSTADSDAVQIQENVIRITEEGTYILDGTLTDGMVMVEAADTAKIQLVLNQVTLTSKDSAAIYVKSADKVFVTTKEGTENYLTNGGTYTAIDENNIDAVIFSKSDLTLNGTGNLQITAGEGHGVVSKDDLVLTGGTYEIEAASHGLSGKDSVRIGGGTYTITSGKDGIHGSNTDDASLGYVYVADGNLNIQAEDDGIHADSATMITGGTVNVSKSYEGLEGLGIEITGGEVHVVSSDDGLNAAGGNDSSGMKGPENDPFATTEGAYIQITGGTLTVDASGDGIDSNGEIRVTGGETYVSGPTNDGNGILDYSGSAVITGGVFVGTGSSGMAQNFDQSSTQGAIMVTTTGTSAGEKVSLKDSNQKEIVSWEPEKEYSCVIVSCPDIQEGETYTITTGTELQEITMDSLVYGSAGRGGEPGSGGGRGQGKGDAGRKNGDHMPPSMTGEAEGPESAL